MNDRINGVALVVYAALLGWYAHAWWRQERRNIAWEAAQKAMEQVRFQQEHSQPPPAEAGAT